MSDSSAFPLIRVKLSQPQVGRSYVDRPRLSELLERALSTPLTLVCAPAGFGKTTLVSNWVASLAGAGSDATRWPAAWLALDDRDNSLGVFLRYFIAAVRTIFPGACSELEEALSAESPLDPALIAAMLSNEIAALPAPFVLVLDDYSAITDGTVQSLFNALLRAWPLPLHLVLTLRRDPPWPLARLRARGQVAEIRAGDLRFTRAETAAYLALRWPEPLPEAVLDRLDNAAEGWIAALQLATLSLGSAQPASDDLAARVSDHMPIMDDLFGEVLSLQPAPIREFLLKTSILERCSAPLATAVMGDHEPGFDSRTCLKWVVDSDLFVTVLDNRQEWCRFHPLFRDFLRKRLAAEFPPRRISRQHERAAGWFAGQGLIDEALYHAMAAGNLDLAARLMEESLAELLNRAEPAMLVRWLNLFPGTYVERRPGLLMAKAWALQFKWQLGAQAAVLDRIETQLGDLDAAGAGAPSEISLLRAQICCLRSQHTYFNGQFARAVALCDESLALLPESWAFARGGAVLFRSICLWAQSGNETVVRTLLADYEALADKADIYALRHLMAWCFIAAQAGNLEELREAAQTLDDQARGAKTGLLRNWGCYFLGAAHYHRNELLQAQKYFADMAQHYAIALAVQLDAYAGLAIVQQAQGDSAGAFETLRLLSGLDLQRVGHEEFRTRSLRARLQLLQGDLKEAGRWADAFTEPVPDQPMLWLETPHLTRARILIARNLGSDVAVALEILDTLNATSERTHNTQHRVEILALRALGLELAGRPEEATLSLRQAVDLARPGGFIRPFVEPGPLMKAMLLKSSGHWAGATQSLRPILAAFPQADAGSTSGEGSTGAPARGTAALVEPLTARELEILELLDRRWSNKEIAQKLYISPMTVKRHVANILGKLGVSRRVDASERARALGILPER